MTPNTTTPERRTERERVRAILVAAGYAPHEADAQLALAQTHLTDWTLRGGAA